MADKNNIYSRLWQEGHFGVMLSTEADVYIDTTFQTALIGVVIESATSAI